MTDQSTISNLSNTTTNSEVFLVATKAILLRPNGKMLTMLRGKSAPTNPLGWDLPGGILEYGEGAEESIIRETKEETGLDIVSPRVFHAIARANQIGEHWTTIYYIGEAPSDEVQVSWEHDEFRWILPEELKDLPGSKRNKEAVEYFLRLRATDNI